MIPADVEAFVRDFRAKHGSDVRRICRKLGIEIRRVDFDSVRTATDTLLVPVVGGFVIAISSKVTMDEATYCHRVAHEIAHTLFYRVREGKPPSRGFPITGEEEDFCNAFADALLKPDV
jgi:hypothetical protein